MKPRFKGDYSQLNWKQFNRFSLAFIVLPYPTMMVACTYHLYSDGIFSYAGFVAIEVIAISTLMASLMLLDAVSALKCRMESSKRMSVEPAARVAAGADYESEDENDGKKIMKRRRAKQNDIDEFGADENQPRSDDDD